MVQTYTLWSLDEEAGLALIPIPLCTCAFQAYLGLLINAFKRAQLFEIGNVTHSSVYTFRQELKWLTEHNVSEDS